MPKTKDQNKTQAGLFVDSQLHNDVRVYALGHGRKYSDVYSEAARRFLDGTLGSAASQVDTLREGLNEDQVTMLVGFREFLLAGPMDRHEVRYMALFLYDFLPQALTNRYIQRHTSNHTRKGA